MGAFKAGAGLFAEGLDHGMSENEGLRKAALRDGTGEGIFEVRKSKLLLRNVCWVFEEEGRGEVVLEVFEYEEAGADGVVLLVEKRWVEVEALSYGEDGVLD